MKRQSIILACLLAAAPVVMAQPKQSAQKKSFDEFRAGIMKDYKDFRQSILENYDKFLEGTWVEYENFKGEMSNPKPKPKAAPVVEDVTPPTVDVELPPAVKPAPVATVPNRPTLPQPGRPTMPDRVDPVRATPIPNHPMIGPDESEQEPEETVAEQPTPEPARPAPVRVRPDADRPNLLPGRPEFDQSTQPKVAPRIDRSRKEAMVKYYGMEIPVGAVDVTLNATMVNNNDVAAQWRALKKDNVAEKVLPTLQEAIDDMGLNDYLAYTFVRDYVKSTQPGVNELARVAYSHYLLCNMGYDVRLALTDRGKPLLLMPFESMLYARPYLNIDGTKYFIFGDDDDPMAGANQRITTCKLPADADAGRPINALLGPLSLPENPHPFNITFDDMTITGEVNANLMPILFRYPQMPTSHFALSTLQPEIREEVVDQVKNHLASLPEREAVDKLLHFVQKAFDYATDDAFHGFEKPYFFEETLYYPKCDCEDRSIFYSYLLWNVLGVQNQLIEFPGHEAVGVKLADEIKGTQYSVDGEKYYISDPTYIGASTGACMPSFKTTAPKVDLTVPGDIR